MKQDTTHPLEGIANAVSYARVSSKSQSREGDGLASQEARCAEFASQRGWKLIGTFRDEISGTALERPGLDALFRLLKKSNQPVAVIVENPDRIARDNMIYWMIKRRVSQEGGVFASPNHDFGTEPVDVMMENIMSSFSQFHRETNARQVTQRMRGRLLNGYWPFHAPMGYKMLQRKHGSKLLIKDEPAASIIQEALGCGLIISRPEA